MGCILINSYFDNTFFTQNRNIILLSMGLIFILISVLAVKEVISIGKYKRELKNLKNVIISSMNEKEKNETLKELDEIEKEVLR